MKHRIFISSVQSEFAKERKALAKYIREDALLGDFFEVFLFEEAPARNRSARAVYLDEVEKCEVYLGLFGTKYGSRDAQGISPTEREYDHATELDKTRLAFVKSVSRREKSEDAFVRGKIDSELSRCAFVDYEQLRKGVYKALVNLLRDCDQISTAPFDQSFSRRVAMDDLDETKFADYVQLVSDAGKVTFPKRISNADVLVRLGLMDKRTKKIANGAVPLFAKCPDAVNPAWEIRCIQYYGTRVVKPIPSLHTYHGTVFELVDQAVDFVMGRVDFAVGAHDGENAAAQTRSEFPRDAIREAIVNAVCHRDYTSNACVQVMLFRDRLEIINPGALPQGISVADLYRTHDSVPRNSLIARAMSWTSYVEKSGSGTGVIIDRCMEHGLTRPEFDPTSGFFKAIIWRTGSGAVKGLVAGASRGLVAGPSRGTQSRDPVVAQSNGPVVAQSRGPVRGPSQGARSRGPVKGPSRILEVISATGDTAVSQIAMAFGKTRASGSMKRSLLALLEDGLIEYTIPDKPNSRLQKYRLTAKGRKLVASFKQKGGRK